MELNVESIEARVKEIEAMLPDHEKAHAAMDDLKDELLHALTKSLVIPFRELECIRTVLKLNELNIQQWG